MIKRLVLSGSAVIATVALSSSLALAAPTGTVSNTGKNSVNVIGSLKLKSCTVTNNNNGGVSTPTVQMAGSGNTSVSGNTTGGNAKSGTAANQNTGSLTVHVTNTVNACPATSSGIGDSGLQGAPSIDTTGSNSLNLVLSAKVSTVSVVNNNNLWVSTPTLQGAQSGSATVSHNTTGGNATSGGAGNTNTSTLTLNVTND